MCLDLIEELEFCTRRNYLDTEHTLKHFRQIGWNSRLFDRTQCDHAVSPDCSDERILKQADEAWRKLVAGQEPVETDPALVREIDRIVESAKQELLA